jgi:hypothetical protein
MEKPTFGSIIRNNLLVLLAAAVLLGLATVLIGDSTVFLFGILYLGQALFNLIMAFVHIGRGPDDVGSAPYFLSMLLVLIIGFGACSGILLFTGGFGNVH